MNYLLLEEVAMIVSERTFAFGTIKESGDTWSLIARDQVILFDLTLSDLALEHKTVSVVGKIGIPPSASESPSSLSKSSQAMRQSKSEPTKYTSPFSLAPQLSSGCAPNANC
jgi:hypothetical protein